MFTIPFTIYTRPVPDAVREIGGAYQYWRVHLEGQRPWDASDQPSWEQAAHIAANQEIRRELRARGVEYHVPDPKRLIIGPFERRERQVWERIVRGHAEGRTIRYLLGHCRKPETRELLRLMLQLPPD